jgi:hypothetical protein
MTNITFEIAPAPALSEADHRRVVTWLQLARPSFRQLAHDAACAAAAYLVAETLAYGLLAGRTQEAIISDLLARGLTEKAEAAAIVDAMQPSERATTEALGLAMQGVMSEPDATPATAERLFLTPLSGADLAYLVGKCREQEAALAPEYEAGRMLPSEQLKFERLRKKLAKLVGAQP